MIENHNYRGFYLGFDIIREQNGEGDRAFVYYRTFKLGREENGESSRELHFASGEIVNLRKVPETIKTMLGEFPDYMAHLYEIDKTIITYKRLTEIEKILWEHNQRAFLLQRARLSSIE